MRHVCAFVLLIAGEVEKVAFCAKRVRCLENLEEDDHTMRKQCDNKEVAEEEMSMIKEQLNPQAVRDDDARTHL